ncbi:YheC/YheD family protein [Neobacillus rhizosphaerae]|uniref:YheC/YheD family endospore coat-associated protein n=1 Tax=Neobacillus rhizosphaerae TaxID=2880965 RepID=UPI003D27690A
MISKSEHPLIGIMTAKKANGTLAGNGLLFIELQKKLISLNGISFVFTPEDADEERIIGYSYSPDKKCWRKETFPYPDLVYNRIPFRKSEHDLSSQRFFSRLKERKIPYFNPCFIDKYELYDLFKNHDVLHRYLPQTIQVNHKKEFALFLNKHTSIYLKPAQSAKGKGIFRLKMIGSEQLQLDSVQLIENFSSLDDFWEKWSKKLLEKNYLAQEEIHSAKYEGARFDFRILAHAEYDNYIVTGVGIRQSHKQVITTHIPSGGKLLPYKLLQSNEHDQFFELIVPLIGSELSTKFGYFGEFSIDACISEDGEYYIYEVNSKPMSFDERHIEDRKIEQLCRLFLQWIKN